MENPQKKIVIIEDDNALSDIYKTRLELIGYTCFIAYNGITGLYFIQTEIPDLVLLDLMVPDIAGDQILLRMRSSLWGKDIPVYIISNLNEADAPKGLRDLGIAGYSVKANLENDEIDQIVNKLLRPEGQPPTTTSAQPSATPSTPPQA
jgi:DNA-binding response OmpR family regulator